MAAAIFRCQLQVGPVLDELLSSRAAAEANNLPQDKRLLFRMDGIRVRGAAPCCAVLWSCCSMDSAWDTQRRHARPAASVSVAARWTKSCHAASSTLLHRCCHQSA